VDAFNKENRWKKRGLSVTPVKFGMSFTAKFMNQVLLSARSMQARMYCDPICLIAKFENPKLLARHSGDWRRAVGEGLGGGGAGHACACVGRRRRWCTSTQTGPSWCPTAAQRSARCDARAHTHAHITRKRDNTSPRSARCGTCATLHQNMLARALAPRPPLDGSVDFQMCLVALAYLLPFSFNGWLCFIQWTR
jgi:hypothetical protein